MKAFFTLLLLTSVTLFVKPAAVHAQASTTDSLALVDLYNATGGTSWTHHTNWLTTGALKNWYGIKLDSTGRVTDVTLGANNLVGTLPASMGNMVKMQHLQLNANKLTGPVPVSFNNYSRILAINLDANYFNFDGLEQLNADILTYTTIGKQHNLPAVYNGEKVIVSGAGGNLAYRAYFFNGSSTAIADSAITAAASGKYYAIITNSKVANFKLYSDTVTVVLPPLAIQADSLALVELYNATGGPAWTNHTNWLTSARMGTWYGVTLGSNGGVTGLRLPANNLNGQMPPNTSVSEILGLTRLDLSNNQLSGILPKKLGSLTKLRELNMSHNSFTGILPNVSKTTFDTADLSYNQLSGPATSFEANYQSLSHNNFTSVQYMGKALVFDVTYNDITFDGVAAFLANSLPTSAFYFQPQHTVKLNVNNFRLSVSVTGASRYGYTDYAWYRGSTLLTTNSGDSTLLVNQSGQYHAVISDENLPAGYSAYSDTVTITTTANVSDSLALVDLYNATNGPGWTNHTNWLTGTVFTWWGISVDGNGRVKNIALDSNNLTGLLPASIGSLSGLQNLQLAGNTLTGNIPSSLGNVTGLQVLNLARNQFSGGIPAEVSKNTALISLNLSFNQLTGAIPDSIIDLVNLQYFNLSDNQLDGSIPDNLGNMAGLVIVDLSDNNLENSVPVSLNNLTHVTQINVAGNRLQFGFLVDLTGAVLSVLNWNEQQPIPLYFDSNSNYVYVLVTGAGNGGGTGGAFSKVFWSVSAANNPDDEDTDGAKVPAEWPVTVPGAFQCTVGSTIPKVGNKYQFFLRSVVRTITEAELPVKLTTFTGQLTHGQAFLNWQTASELNSAYFGVQRSIDGTNFTTVGKVAAAGTSAVAQNYAFTDALTGLATIPAQLYYRLQQVDKDGKQNMSKTIVLTPAPGGSSSLIMYPNPVRSILNLRLKGIPGNAAITITDAAGKTLLAQSAKTVTGGQTISLNTARLAAGVYIVHVQYNGQSEEQKFVKE